MLTLRIDKIVQISVDLELNLLGDLRHEVETDDALVLGHVQAVVRAANGRQELERDQRADLAGNVCRRPHVLVDHRVEDGHHPIEREGLGARELRGGPLLPRRGQRLALLAVMLHEEALVALHRVVGGQVRGDQQELGVEGQLYVQPAVGHGGGGGGRGAGSSRGAGAGGGLVLRGLELLAGRLPDVDLCLGLLEPLLDVADERTGVVRVGLSAVDWRAVGGKVVAGDPQKEGERAVTDVKHP